MMQPTTHPYRLCVSLARPTLAALLAAANRAAPLADVLEIRLDALAGETGAAGIADTVRELTARLDVPLLFTNRPGWEKGAFDGPEEERLAPLLAALAAGCAYVDIELRAPEESRRQIVAAAGKRGAAAKVIVSWHDFSGTPADSELAGIVAKMRATGADIGKLVTMAHSFQDVLRVLNLQNLAVELNFPLIAFCMGEAGMISRLATCHLGGYMTYAAAEAGEATAPGQLPAALLRRIEELLGMEG